MPRQRPANPYQIYIDATVLVDLANRTSSRQKQAWRFIRLIQRFSVPRRSRMLQLVTSAWAVAEAHGVLYEQALKHNNAPHPVRGGEKKNVRYTIPPRTPELTAAWQQLNSVVDTLDKTTSFHLLNDASPDTTQLWQLVNRIGQEAAIYPTDSVHLALALQTGCSMIVSDDGDFLDKIECCNNTLIQPYRASEFSHIENLLPFRFHGVRPSTSIIPGRSQQTRPPALTVLQSLGFRL